VIPDAIWQWRSAGELFYAAAPFQDVHVLRNRRRAAQYIDEHRELVAGHKTHV
jgi:hypothetical protein